MIEVFDKILKVPEKWDNIFSESSYLSKKYLKILENSNPCSQRYVIINNRSAFVVYKMILDIFSYSKLKLNLKVNIIGVPCSVAKSGYKIHGDDIKEMMDYIKKDKGSYIILNSDDSFLSEELIRGETLPTCKLNISWDSFEDYKKNLRSHYRYRINSAIKKGKDLDIKKLQCNSHFNEELYVNVNIKMKKSSNIKMYESLIVLCIEIAKHFVCLFCFLNIIYNILRPIGWANDFDNVRMMKEPVQYSVS